MKNLYAQLATAFGDKTYRISKEQSLQFNELSHFVAMKGDHYDVQNCRLMIIGRAVNGWGSIACPNAKEFGVQAEQVFNGTGFEWVVYDERGLHNTEDKIYFLSRSPFWRTSQQIWEQLSGVRQDKWVDYIAWSNIYKVAPPTTGNPTTKMCRTQIELCRQILKKEIETYKPTHILFVTGWNWWFQDSKFGVAKLFEQTNFIKENKRGNTTYAEGTAIYKGVNVDIPVVVACRPEQRNEQEYVKQVVETFKKLEEK